MFKRLTTIAMVVFAIQLAAPTLAQTSIDSRANSWSHHSNAVPVAAHPEVCCSNCQGALLSGLNSNYAIENAIGNGAEVEETGTILNYPKIYGATGSGIVSKASCTQITYGLIKGVRGNGIELNGTNNSVIETVIDGAGGAGIVINGDDNYVHNVTIINCGRPIVVHGKANHIDWASIHIVSSAKATSSRIASDLSSVMQRQDTDRRDIAGSLDKCGLKATDAEQAKDGASNLTEVAEPVRKKETHLRLLRTFESSSSETTGEKADSN